MATRSNIFAFGLCALSIVAGCYNNPPITEPDDAATSKDVAADVKDEGDAIDLDVPTFPEVGGDTATPDVPASDGASDKPASDVTPTEAAVDAPVDVAPDMLCRTRCAGACSDPDTDVHNCGACGNDCALRPGVDMALARCVMGRCDFTGACLPGRANCSGNPDDGCESMLNSPTRCGSCTNVCRDPTPNCGPMTGAPGGYACTSGCVGAGSMRCGAACVDTMTDPRNCGSCGTVCPSGALGTPACVMGRCTFTCIANYGDCDGVATNGCETPLRTSVMHCGMCGNACAAPAGVTPMCALGTCSITCALNLGNCDMNLMNGCETNLRTDAMNCGTCGNACGGRPNSTGTCSASACLLTCNMGYANCNSVVSDGCEAEVSRDPLNCGACARRCAAAANATPTCVDSSCGIACNMGYGNCDGNGLNGCETPLLADARNCGACGTVCPSAAGAAGACVAGRCALMCGAGLADCDGMTSNGCEANTNTSNTHCGGCGMACSAPSNASAQCTAGRCVVTCDDGYTLSGSMCVRAAPRPVAPAGGAIATTRRPTFRVALAAGLTGARIEVCGDRLCTAVATTLMATGASVTSSATLMPGVYYWRATGTIAGAAVTATSPVTEFAVVAGNSATTSSTWGPIFDANADRYVDLLVGSPSLNRVQYWTNSSGTYSTVGYTIISGASGLGTAVAAAGDLNGDGYGDAIFGAPTANVVQVHHGGVSGIVTTPTLTLTAPTGATRFGAAVASAGDVNGDGFGDVIIGAPGSTRAYLYYGREAGIDTMVAPVTLAPTGAGANFGVSVAGVGDINADGFGDIAIGTDGASIVYLWYGGRTGLGPTPTGISAPVGANGFGRAVAGAGDVNGDGYPDVVVGAYNSASAYLFLGGSAGLNTTSTATLTGCGTLGGIAVDGAGDVNGDGFGDVVMGASTGDRTCVYYGAASAIPSAPATVLTPTYVSYQFGTAVSGIGDSNLDGYSDVIASSLSRAVQVYRGAAAGATLSVTLTGSTSFGQSIASRPAHRRPRS